MITIGTNIAWPDASCCAPNYPAGCVCQPMEKALHGWVRRDPAIPAMTVEQREACLAEIGRIKGYRRSDAEGLDDSDLASTVLAAWLDYCRDKGLL